MTPITPFVPEIHFGFTNKTKFLLALIWSSMPARTVDDDGGQQDDDDEDDDVDEDVVG